MEDLVDAVVGRSQHIMQSETIERVFGGITYLFGALSKYEFYGHLDAFLAEVLGPLRFSVVTVREGGGRLQVEFTNHPDIPVLGDEPIEAVCADLLRLLPGARDYRAGAEPLRLGAVGCDVPILWAKPLCVGERRLGWIAFHDALPPGGGDAKVFGVETFVFDHVSLAFYRVQDLHQTQEKLELMEAKLSAINGVGELIGSLDLDVLLTKLMELSLFIASAQVGCIALRGEKGIESRVEWGLSLEVVEQLRYRGGKSILESVVESGEPVLVRQFGDSPDYEGIPELRVDSYLCVPLQTKGKILGAICLVHSGGDLGFRKEDALSIQTISGLAATAIENAILHRDSLEKERITADLRIARSIQHRMYPKECPRVPGYDMAWVNISCQETGGDYFDFIPMGEEDLVAVIGDVSGHGIGAALLMATGRANLRALCSIGRGIREVMPALDALLERDMDVEKFMTLFLGNLNHRRHELTYLNAGHDKPLLYRAGAKDVRELASTGLPLGILGAAGVHTDVAPIGVEVGDVLFLMTDGVWEETNLAGERFGRERLIAAFRGAAGGTASQIIQSIQDDVFRFTRGVER